MDAQELEAHIIDALADDDVKTFDAMVKKWNVDVHQVYQVSDPEGDYEFSALTYAATMNAVAIVAHLMAQGVSKSMPCFRPYEVMQHEEDSHGRQVIDEDRCEKPFTALNLATYIYGRDSHVAQLLRGEYHDTLRRGFDALYFRALRKAYAPNCPAAKRAKQQYESECM